ncbi:MAG: endonuclease domain-containing protein [Candidatus Brocadia sp.]|nr:endonuclease domain-containing protein [Candidatus Brocadia sp.]
MKIYYNQKLKFLSRELRKKSTLSEVLLWNKLKARKIKGYQFMRQKPIGKYIVDFYCSKLKLVIEIDGISHNDKSEKDRARQKQLESLGLSLLRFYEWDVKKDMNAVVQVIESWIEEFEKKHNPLNPPLGKGDLK